MQQFRSYVCLQEPPLFLVVKPFEMNGRKEVFHHSIRRQQALVNLMLDLDFEERNKDYPLEIPFLIWVPHSAKLDTKRYFEAFFF
jgi:hypothetical protein